MKYHLSDNTKKLIKNEKITQQELAKKINELYEKGKVIRSISQQSISRYINGADLLYEDTEKIILKAVSSLLGARRYRIKRKLYKEEMAKKKSLEEKKMAAMVKRNYNLGLSLRDIATNDNLRDMLMSDEEIDFYERRQEEAEQGQILSFWRSAPLSIQSYWLETLDIFEEFSRFMKEVILCMIGIKEDHLLELLQESYLQYCSDCVYVKYAREFTDKELRVLGQIMIASGKSCNKLYEFIDEGSDIYKILVNGKYEWKVYERDKSYQPENENEKLFLEYYEKSRMEYEDFLYYASLTVCMERTDWLVLHNAFVFEKMQKGVANIEICTNLWGTEIEKEFIDNLKVCQKEDLKEA